MILIDIPRRSRNCVKGQEPFSPGSLYYSRLVPAKEGEYSREDFCPECWKTEESESSHEAGKVHWKGLVPKKTALEKKADSQEKALEALKNALDGPEEEDKKEALLIALFLQRKKVLISRGELSKKGAVRFLFEVAETEEMIAVPKVLLTSGDAQLQARIAERL